MNFCANASYVMPTNVHAASHVYVDVDLMQTCAQRFIHSCAFMASI